MLGQGDPARPLSISNGSADLKLGFQLGLTTETHLHPQHQHKTVFSSVQNLLKAEKKSPSWCRHDLVCSAKHQAAAHQPGQGQSTSTIDAAAAPTKAVTTPVRKFKWYIDVNSAKKNLLTTGAKPPLLSQDPQKISYQQNEQKLWTKLFLM